MKKKLILCYGLLQGSCMGLFAQSNLNVLTVLDEYGDTLKPLYVRYKLVHEAKFKDCRDCVYESGLVNLSILKQGVYTLKLRLDDGLDMIERSIQIPLEKDTLMVSVSPKSIFESGEPAQIITAEQLTLSGKNTLEEALVYLLPSFYASWQTLADKTEVFTPTSMKGMGPDQFLVLINGKRRHSTSVLHLNGTFGRGAVSNDLVNIPISSVKAIEVKNAAASVWHGSDAIAGVINIQLHDKPIPFTIGIQGGWYYPSGFGYADDNGNGQWWSKNGLGNEKEGKIYWQSFHYLGKAKKGFLSLGGDLIHLGHINRTGNYNGTFFKDSLANTIAEKVDTFWNDVRNSSGFARNKVLINGRAAIQQASAYFNLEAPIYQGYFYASGGFSYKTGDIVGIYRFPKDIALDTFKLIPHGYSPHLVPKASDYYLTTGMKWNVYGLGNLDIAYSTGAHTVHNYLENSFNADLNYTQSFRSKDTMPRDFYAGANFYRQQTLDIQLHRLIPIEKGKLHLDITSGISLRTETFGTVAGEESAYYFTANDKTQNELPSFHPDEAIERDRKNYGAFLQGKLIIRVSQNWVTHVTPGGRYETFSNFQGKPIFKLSNVWLYSGDKNEIDFRVSWNQGFRTPSLHQIYFTGVSSQYRGAKANLVYIGSNQSILARAMGAKPLQSETAESCNLGGSWRNKSKNRVLNVDYSQTIVENRIVLSAFFDDTKKIFDISNQLVINLKDRGINSALFFLNYPTTTTHSVDVSFEWKLNPAVQLLFGANWNQTRISATTDTALNKVFERQERSRYDSIIPNFKGFILLHGRYKKFGYKFQTTIFGQNYFVAPEDPIDNVDKDKIKFVDQVFNNQNQRLIDLELSYHANPKAKIAIGCNNLLGYKSNRIDKWEVVAKKVKEGTNEDASALEKERWEANVSNYNALQYSRRVQTFGVGGSFIYTKFTYNLF